MGCNGLNGRGAQSRKVTKKNTNMLELAATLDYFPRHQRARDEEREITVTQTLEKQRAGMDTYAFISS